MITSQRTNAMSLPRFAVPSLKAKSVQCRRDDLIQVVCSHLPDHFHGFHRGSMSMLPATGFLHTNLGMAVSGPVDQQQDFIGFLIDVNNDFFNQDPHDPLFETQVGRGRMPHGFQIVGEA